MAIIIEWLRSVMQLDQVSEIRHLVGAIRVDPDVLMTVLLYLCALSWLAYRWRTRTRGGRRAQFWRGVATSDCILRFLGTVVLLAFFVLLALTRAAGRSHYRW